VHEHRVETAHREEPVVAPNANHFFEEEQFTVDAAKTVMHPAHSADIPAEHVEVAEAPERRRTEGWADAVSEHSEQFVETATVAVERDLYPRETRSVFAEPDTEEGRDTLDIPAFLRRGGL